MQLVELFMLRTGQQLIVPIKDQVGLLSSSIQVAAKVGGGIGYFLFCYSLALILRAAVRIFSLSRWYNTYLNSAARKKQSADTGPADVPALEDGKKE